MADTAVSLSKEKLGVGNIIGDTFSLFVGRIKDIFILTFLPTLLIVVVQYLLTPSVDLENSQAFDPDQASVWGPLLSGLISMVGVSLITALIVRLAYDAKIGNPMRPGAYFSSALAVIVPLVICTLIVSFAMGIAAIALIIPGLWVYAVWCVVVPAIVIENAGFGSFGRSAQLTKEYRWPCLGAILVVGICAYIPVLLILIFFGFGMTSSGIASGAVLILIHTLATTVYLAMIGICVALIYARLREIKEGTSVEQLADVFA